MARTFHRPFENICIYSNSCHEDILLTFWMAVTQELVFIQLIQSIILKYNYQVLVLKLLLSLFKIQYLQYPQK